MNDYQLKTNDVLDEKWKIKRSIGRGGFAEVYLVESDIYPEAALKLYTNPALDYRHFASEIITMGLFNNKPYFVKLYGGDLFGQNPYIVMEYMPGGDLRHCMKERAFTLDESNEIILFLSYALDDMHKIGVIHRDVSPDNIFFDAHDQVKLGDMGAALSIQELGEAIFKITYAAPEVLNGEYTTKGDIYSLGVVYCELLGGNPRERRCENSISELKIPDHTKEILAKMCHPDPEQRPTAAELKNILKWSSGTVYQTVSTTIQESHTESNSPASRELIFNHNFLQEERLKNVKALFEKQETGIMKGLNPELKAIIYNALLFSLMSNPDKNSNGYLGLEHMIWTLLDTSGILFSTLAEKGISEEKYEELKNKIFSYLNVIQYDPSDSILSRRLYDILEESKKLYPDGVGIKEFLIQLFSKPTFFQVLLSQFNIDVNKLREELYQ